MIEDRATAIKEEFDEAARTHREAIEEQKTRRRDALVEARRMRD